MASGASWRSWRLGASRPLLDSGASCAYWALCLDAGCLVAFAAMGTSALLVSRWQSARSVPPCRVPDCACRLRVSAALGPAYQHSASSPTRSPRPRGSGCRRSGCSRSGLMAGGLLGSWHRVRWVRAERALRLGLRIRRHRDGILGSRAFGADSRLWAPTGWVRVSTRCLAAIPVTSGLACGSAPSPSPSPSTCWAPR